MKPLYFKEAHIELKKPNNMTDEECGSLWVHRSERGECISLWTVPFLERLKFLFHGKLWLGINSGKTQPPVWLDMNKTLFVKE
ncbi:MAG: hypothetical protein GY928_02080 [Colwellia sp.]|nr:hypothetical protein [Colwellia sp.]